MIRLLQAAAAGCLVLSSCLVSAQERDATLDELLSRLQSTIGEEREDTRKAIAELGEANPEVIPELIKLLDDPLPSKRSTAAEALGEIGKPQPEVIAALLKLLEDKARRSDQMPVWIFAASALGKLGPTTTPDLIQRLDHNKTCVRRGAAIALHGIGPAAEKAVPALKTLLDEDDPETRDEAIYALYGIGKASAPAMPSLRKMLHSDDFHTQYWSCRAIGKIGPPQALDAVPKLLELTKDDVTSVRRNAVDAIGEIGPGAGERVLPALETALKDPVHVVRRAAAIALGKLGRFAESSVPALGEALQKRNSMPSELAGALWQVTGEPQPGLEILLTEIQKRDAPWQAAMAFQRLGSAAKPAVSPLAKLLESDNPETQLFAAKAIGGIGRDAKEALPALQKLSNSQDEFLREVAENTIRQIQVNEKADSPSGIE